MSQRPSATTVEQEKLELKQDWLAEENGMSYETPEEKKAELIRLRLEELKPLLEEVGQNTNNKAMTKFRNQLAHCSITYSPYGTVFMKEISVMRKLASEARSHNGEERIEDDQGYEKISVCVEGKKKVLCHVYPLEQWKGLYNRFLVELSQAGELIPLPRRVAGCPRCGDFPRDHNRGGQSVCPHVRNGDEKAYIRDEFGDIVGNMPFSRTPSK